ncbi:hypothetical protein ACC806_03950 [Rhizobium ruizarguesonis]
MTVDWNVVSAIGSAVSAVGSIVSMGIAAYALLYARRQVELARSASEDARRTSKESEALQAYSAYLDRCVQYPQFSSWEMFEKHCGAGDIENVWKTLSKESERYLWFLSILITVCDQIIVDVPKSKLWEPILLTQLGYHKEFLRVAPERFVSAYHEKTVALINRAKNGDDENGSKD